MTNINCSADCIYQVDGKCSLDNINFQSSITPNEDCAYFNSHKRSVFPTYGVHRASLKNKKSFFL